MGILSWLFPSESDKIAQARTMVGQKRFREARDRLDGITGEEADSIRREAENGLVRLNLDAVLTWAEAGEDERVEQHLALAEELHRGGLEADLRATRAKVREIRGARRAAAAAEQNKRAQVPDDPLGLTGRTLLAEHGRNAEAEDSEDEARWGLILANYPSTLRTAIGELGPEFKQAAIDLENGRPDLAMQALGGLGDQSIPVVWERARASYALGDPTTAIRDLKRLAALAGRHQAMPGEHSGVLLCRILAEIGRIDESFQLLSELREEGISEANWLFAQVSYALALRDSPQSMQLLGGAEQALRELLLAHPKQTSFHHLLAKVRLAGGYRVPAMQALEAALAACCDAPGKCGSQPPDPAIQRDLAILYLEDRMEIPRAVELADAAAQATKEPSWEDLYLQALVAREQKDPDALSLIEELRANTPPAQQDRLRRYLAA